MSTATLNFNSINVPKTSYYCVPFSQQVDLGSALHIVGALKSGKIIVNDIGRYSNKDGHDCFFMEIDPFGLDDPVHIQRSIGAAKVGKIDLGELEFIKNIQKEQKAYILRLSRKDGKPVSEASTLEYSRKFGAVLMIKSLGPLETLVKYSTLSEALACSEDSKLPSGQHLVAFNGCSSATSSKTLAGPQPFKINLFHSLQDQKTWTAQPKKLAQSNPEYAPKTSNEQLISKMSTWGIHGVSISTAETSNQIFAQDESLLSDNSRDLHIDESIIEKRDSAHSSDEDGNPFEKE